MGQQAREKKSLRAVLSRDVKNVRSSNYKKCIVAALAIISYSRSLLLI